MNSKIDKIRNWLDTNKIFFETIVAVGLTVMAIMLTLMSINVSDKSNQISFYETELMKMENQPIMHFDVNYLYHFENNSEYWEERLTINNVGSPLKEFDCDTMVFIRISYRENGNLSKFALIPINDYYLISLPTGSLSGRLTNITGYYNPNEKIWNHNKVIQTGLLFIEFAENNNASGYIEIVRFVKTEYRDIFENIHTDIYFVDPFGTRTHKLNKEDGKIISDYYESFWWSENFNIEDLSPNAIYNNFLKNNKKFEEDKMSSLEWEMY